MKQKTENDPLPSTMSREDRGVEVRNVKLALEHARCVDRYLELASLPALNLEGQVREAAGASLKERVCKDKRLIRAEKCPICRSTLRDFVCEWCSVYWGSGKCSGRWDEHASLGVGSIRHHNVDYLKPPKEAKK